MPERPKGFALRVTRKQGILIAILGVALAFVVFESSSPSDSGAEKSGTDSESPPVRKKPVAKTAPVAELRRVSLPVETMIKQNPFAKLPEPPKPAPPKAAPPPTAPVTVSIPKPSQEDLNAKKRIKERQQQIQQTIAELQGQKVRMVLRTDKKTSAMIGNRLVSEGDVINGVRIVSILPTGVIVKPAPGD